MKSCLNTEELAVGYPKKQIVSQISLSLREGEIFALIGPNGAGKTTVLKTLARQLAPLGGEIFLRGEDYRQMDGKVFAREAAFVRAGKTALEMMTVEDVVSAGRYPYTGAFGILSDADRGKVREAMQLVGLETLADASFQTLSDGQKQRTVLARALCQEPKLLVLDEPTSFLDIRYKLEFLSLLQKMAREKQMSVLISLHELDLAERVADQVACVKDGKIICYGPVREVFTANNIETLFSLKAGTFHETDDSVELSAPEGEAKVFVIAGAGCGTPVFRLLQKKGIPFSTGILWENDRDIPAADALAAQILRVPAFSAIGEAELAEAESLIRQAEQVIVALPPEKMTGAALPLQELVRFSQEQRKWNREEQEKTYGF